MRTNDDAVCLAVLLCLLSTHINIMADKGFNLFNEFAPRYLGGYVLIF